MLIPDFTPFKGEHCETMATGNLLKHCGINLSEPMLFGLGEGLGFAVLNFKNMPLPFIGGRPRPEDITKALAKNLGLDIEFRKTSSKKKAWQNVKTFIDAGQPVAVRIDAYYLDYFTAGIHFGGHYLAAHGYDDEYVYVIDTQQQGADLRTDRAAFEVGRLWRGPMAPNGITWTIANCPESIDLPKAIRAAIVNNAHMFLNPPIRNFGAKGIRKAAKLIPTWFTTLDDGAAVLAHVGMLMERGGTGGSLFRNFYRDFLAEANQYLESQAVSTAHEKFAQAASLWKDVAEYLLATPEIGDSKLAEVADILLHLADLEETAVKQLAML